MIRIRKIIRLAAQAGISLIVISISRIPMSAKEEERRVRRPSRGRKLLLRERRFMIAREGS